MNANGRRISYSAPARRRVRRINLDEQAVRAEHADEAGARHQLVAAGGVQPGQRVDRAEVDAGESAHVADHDGVVDVLARHPLPPPPVLDRDDRQRGAN